MKEVLVGTVIAQRQLTAEENGSPIEIQILIGKPVAHEEGDWVCPYEIKFPDKSRTFFAAGVDSVQALFLAMVAIGAELRHRYDDLHLRWLGEEKLGFPVEVPEWS